VRALIVADGEVRLGSALETALSGVDLIVAADGGARKAAGLGLRPQVVVGDGDSLSSDAADELRLGGVEVIIHPVEKDESDAELAVREALSRGATSLVVLGVFGGQRVEHTIANLLLLTLPEVAAIDASLVDGPSTVRVIGVTGSGQLTIHGEPGDFVSLLPLSEKVTGVTTDGMRYPLADATLTQGATRGLSNELLDLVGAVRIREGRLAVIHTRRDEDVS
jgi:thiamine pyrophosphokinase